MSATNIHNTQLPGKDEIILRFYYKYKCIQNLYKIYKRYIQVQNKANNMHKYLYERYKYTEHTSAGKSQNHIAFILKNKYKYKNK